MGRALLVIPLLVVGLAVGVPDSVGLPVGHQQQEQSWRAVDWGRLTARPRPGPKAKAAIGLQPLGLGAARGALIYVPASYRPEDPAPLLVILHGRSADARAVMTLLIPFADETG